MKEVSYTRYISNLKVHGLAGELCELRANGFSAEAMARFGELRTLSDALFVELKVCQC